MDLLHGVGEFFALDIGTSSLRLVQLDGDAQHGWNLSRFSYVPVDSAVIQDNSELGKKKMGEIILGAIQQAGIKCTNVAIGMPSQKSYTTIVEFPTQPMKDLEKTIKYRIDQYVPMTEDQAKSDFVILGVSPNDPAKTEVLIASTANEYAESRMEMLERIGLNVIAEEPEVLAMSRALMPFGVTDGRMVVDFGDRATDLVIMYNNLPRVVRAVPIGMESLIRTVASSLSVTNEQASQFIMKFGLAQDKVEGQVFRVLDSVLDAFAEELKKSANYFNSKYPNVNVGGIVLSGYAEIIPFMAEYIEAKTGVSTIQGNPWQMVRVTPEQQQALTSVASKFAVAIGLAERSND